MMTGRHCYLYNKPCKLLKLICEQANNPQKIPKLSLRLRNRPYKLLKQICEPPEPNFTRPNKPYKIPKPSLRL